MHVFYSCYRMKKKKNVQKISKSWFTGAILCLVCQAIIWIFFYYYSSFQPLLRMRHYASNKHLEVFRC